MLSVAAGHEGDPAGGSIERVRLSESSLLWLRTRGGAWHAEAVGTDEVEEGLGDTESQSWLARPGTAARHHDGFPVCPLGSMTSMAKQKVTITLDRLKADEARLLVGSSNTSEVIDVALGRLIRAEWLRRDIDAYRRLPPTDTDLLIALQADASGLADDTDWEALYGDEAG
jgi:hypothetical protein